VNFAIKKIPKKILDKKNQKLIL